LVEASTAPVFADESAPCQNAGVEKEAPGSAKKTPTSVPLLEDVVWANALRTTTSPSASTSGNTAGIAGCLESVASIP
jgi:hypothetical protein